MNRFKFSKLPIIISVFAFVFLIGGMLLTKSGNTEASNSSIQVDRDRLPPSRNLQLGELPEFITVPILTIPDSNSYHEHQVGDSIKATHNYPVAQLQEINKDTVRRITISFNEQTDSADPEAIAYYVTSSIRYELKDGIVYVSTTRLSPKAQQIPISFSGDNIKLDNGIEAWLDTQIQSETTPRAINYIDGDFIITITGSVSEKQLQDLAAQIILKN